jgi:molybdopterin molybdotransferase
MAAKLTPVADALQQILENVAPSGDIQRLPLLQALGCVLAEDIVSPIDVPPVDNSAMDGFVFALNDYVEGHALPISQRILAGHDPLTLRAGTAARIFTGAEIPEGGDVVVMQENTEYDDAEIKVVGGTVKAGQNIRRRAQDIQSGQVLFHKGQRLRPQDVAVISSVGIAECDVYKPLKVAVLSTGDELLEPGDAHQHGKIYNSNRHTLMAMLASLGMDVMDGGTIGDTVEQSAEALQRLAEKADVLISSGGVSVGEADFVKEALQRVGKQRVWKLAMKPGKPLVFGDISGSTFFGLPGNPAAVFATFCVIVRPYLLRRQGQLGNVMPPVVQAVATFDFPKAGTRQEYLRARVENDSNGLLQASIHSNQSSGVLSSASWGNAFVVMPIGRTVKAGDTVDVLLFDSLLG